MVFFSACGSPHQTACDLMFGHCSFRLPAWVLSFMWPFRSKLPFLLIASLFLGSWVSEFVLTALVEKCVWFGRHLCLFSEYPRGGFLSFLLLHPSRSSWTPSRLLHSCPSCPPAFPFCVLHLTFIYIILPRRLRTCKSTVTGHIVTVEEEIHQIAVLLIPWTGDRSSHRCSPSTPRAKREEAQTAPLEKKIVLDRSLLPNDSSHHLPELRKNCQITMCSLPERDLKCSDT